MNLPHHQPSESKGMTQADFLIRAVQVRISQRQGTRGFYNSIKVVFNADLQLSCDLADGVAGARQIRLAKSLADNHQATFMYDDHNAPAVREECGIVACEAAAEISDTQVRDQDELFGCLPTAPEEKSNG